MNRSLILAVPILMTAVACSRQQDPRVAAAVQPTTAVQVDTVATSQVTDIYRASGTVHARQIADISAKIVANILEVRVHAGDHVQAGQALVVLDRRDLEANLHRAEAVYTEAENAVGETENAITS